MTLQVLEPKDCAEEEKKGHKQFSTTGSPIDCDGVCFGIEQEEQCGIKSTPSVFQELMGENIEQDHDAAVDQEIGQTKNKGTAIGKKIVQIKGENNDGAVQVKGIRRKQKLPGMTGMVKVNEIVSQQAFTKKGGKKQNDQ